MGDDDAKMQFRSFIQRDRALESAVCVVRGYKTYVDGEGGSRLSS